MQDLRQDVKDYCLGVVGRVAGVVGRGRAPGAPADGAAGGGAATPEEALYAFTTANVTSMFGFWLAHITLLFC